MVWPSTLRHVNSFVKQRPTLQTVETSTTSLNGIQRYLQTLFQILPAATRNNIVSNAFTDPIITKAQKCHCTPGCYLTLQYGHHKIRKTTNQKCLGRNWKHANLLQQFETSSSIAKKCEKTSWRFRCRRLNSVNATIFFARPNLTRMLSFGFITLLSSCNKKSTGYPMSYESIFRWTVRW